MHRPFLEFSIAVARQIEDDGGDEACVHAHKDVNEATEAVLFNNDIFSSTPLEDKCRDIRSMVKSELK